MIPIKSELSVWVRAVREAETTGDSRSLSVLYAEGMRLLQKADATDSAWPRAWQHCWRTIPEEERASLMEMGRVWFTTQYASFESSRILEQMRKSPFPRASYEALWGWLRTHTSSPLWIQIAARMVHIDPSAEEASDTFETLLADPKAAVHRRTFPALLKNRKAPLSLRRRVLEDLGYSKDEISRWSAWRSSLLAHRLPSAWAQVVGPSVDQITVDGYAAEWTSPLRPPLCDVGRTVPIKIRSLDEVNRSLGVALSYAHPDETVIPGTEEDGTVSTIQQYGIFVRFRNFVGLAHVSRFPTQMFPETFAPGTSVRVKILDVKKERVELELLA